MRFAGRVSAANYVQAGQIAAEQSSAFAEIARENAPRYEEQVQESIKQEALKYENAVLNQAGVVNAATDAATNVALGKNRVDVFEANEKAKSSMRKAGILTRAGAMLGQGLANEPEKPVRQVDTSMLQDEYTRLKALEAKHRGEASKHGSYEYEGSDTPSTTDSTATQSSDSKPQQLSGGNVPASERGMKMMSEMIADGYTPVQAAGIVGNAQYESDNFRAYEEYVTNDYGTKGGGVIQWTDTPGSPRRTNFENWAKAQGLDPTSDAANTGYLLHEIKGPGVWSGGMNDKSYRQIGDLNTAVTAFQNNYLRPKAAVANTPQRLANAQALLDAWNNR